MSDKVGNLIEEVAERLGEFGVGAEYSDDPWDSLEVQTVRGKYCFTSDDNDDAMTWSGSLHDSYLPERITTGVDSNEKDRNVIASGIYFELLIRDLLPEGHDRVGH